VLAGIHERIGDKRTDFSNQVSRQLVNRFGVIVFEYLDIQNMLKNHHLAKSISDVAWGMLVKATESKAAYSGSKVVLVDPKYTSQMSSWCGMIVKKDLSERIHNCSECGLTMDRDLNAAINILRLGMQSVRKSDRSSVLLGGERSQWGSLLFPVANLCELCASVVDVDSLLGWVNANGYRLQQSALRIHRGLKT
jgi:putative transposase